MVAMASAYLAAYHDPKLVVRATDTTGAMAAVEIDRLVRQASIMRAAAEIPRRIGGDANSDELSLDKKRCRRVQHALSQCWHDWTHKKKLAWLVSEDVRREAASLRWESWWGDHRVYLQQRTLYIATWGMGTEADARWAKSSVVRLQNELRWVEYSLR